MKKLTLISLLLINLIMINSVFSADKSTNKKAPEFNLSGLNSETIELSNYKGKVVYLDFWATWCGPCRKSFPWMNEMQKKYQSQGLEIIAVSLDAKKKMVETFLKKYPADFTIALDPDGESGDSYKVRVMPSSYIIDRNGDIIERHMGFRTKDKDKLEEMIKSVLSK